ncbi:TIGR00725 family protein [Halorussus salinus]|uniref:TIGR00725 family protein n=1 Tax=Halorussus salinus TaxID=1364935 RepID=UPI001091F463|nr:TIGR00725 family protein [Halorussus salinus]
MRVSVIGGSTVTESQAKSAERVGRRLAQRGHTVVCGGLGGVMEAACRGASETDGRTIGILPGEERAAANPHVDVPIATGLGHARNALVVMNGDAVIAVDGGVGTLSEVGYAGVFDRPIAGIGTHDAPGVEPVGSAAEAVTYVEETVESRGETDV